MASLKDFSCKAFQPFSFTRGKRCSFSSPSLRGRKLSIEGTWRKKRNDDDGNMVETWLGNNNSARRECESFPPKGKEGIRVESDLPSAKLWDDEEEILDTGGKIIHPREIRS